MMFNVVGIYQWHTNIESIAAAKADRKLDVTLKDLEGRELVAILWENYADEFLGFLEAWGETDNPLMIALQFVAISKYRDLVRVQTKKNHSILMMDPQSEEITHFLNSVPEDSLIANSNDTTVTKHADWFTPDSSMTIKDLLSCSEPGTYIIIAEIQDIDTMNWYYDSCSKCRKKPKKGSKKPPAIVGETCESCFQVIDGYRIKLEAKDSTGQTVFILLDQQARAILKKSATDMLADSGKKGHAPEEFDKFFENEWIFRVQVQQEYNIIEKKTEYSVMNISNDQNLIAQFAKEKSCI
ncbi:hypothetical protein OROGR_027828 [Orobanche gracilis]